jgi:predicted NBD/HSP70 family sugar kinase
MVSRCSPARPDAIRRHNLGLLLSEIHRDGALTRAELTRRLHLSRSTVGALVADLTDLGILEEHVPTGGSRAGRPSHVVGPRAAGPYAVAVDVDVGKVTSAAVGIGGRILAREETDTAGTPDVLVRHIIEAGARLHSRVSAGAWPIGIGVSVPGTVRRSDGLVEFAPNLGWRHADFGALLAARAPADLPVSVGNDADLAVLAERARGNARGCDDVVYLMGRIGVGAGIIVNGSPLRGYDGFAGEVGHNVVDSSGPECHCGKRGCMETYVGDAALMKLAGRRVPPTTENVAAVLAGARGGDERAEEAVRTVAQSLGRAIAGLVNLLNPQRVVLGGSFAGVYDFARDLVEKAMTADAMARLSECVQLCLPGLGDDSSLLGAADAAFARLLDDPSQAASR